MNTRTGLLDPRHATPHSRPPESTAVKPTVCTTSLATTSHAAEQARARFASTPGGAFLVSDWSRALLVPMQVDPAALQSMLPRGVEMDLRNGGAFLGLSVHLMTNLRVSTGGRLVHWPGPTTADGAVPAFVSLQACVQHEQEPAWLALGTWMVDWVRGRFGPRTFGLPLHVASMQVRHEHERSQFHGSISALDRQSGLQYSGSLSHPNFAPANEGSLAAFVFDRHTLLTSERGLLRRVRMDREPWAVTPVQLIWEDDSLLDGALGPLREHMEVTAAYYSLGIPNVQMTRPECIAGPHCARDWMAPPAG